MRITLTALLIERAGDARAAAWFHDVAGWFMMLLALGVLWLELRLLDRLFVTETEPEGK